jgi:hypothetical protein
LSSELIRCDKETLQQLRQAQRRWDNVSTGTHTTVYVGTGLPQQFILFFSLSFVSSTAFSFVFLISVLSAEADIQLFQLVPLIGAETNASSVPLHSVMT